MAQKITDTGFDRYPGIFRTVRARVAERFGASLGGGRLRILSFGCSSGLELRSLRTYFPDAALFGCDVNVEMLAAARRAGRQHRARLFLSQPAAIAAFAPYDAIFVMSVLCRYPRSRTVETLTPIFPFREFETTTQHLHEALAPGGMLCLYNSNYPFSLLDAAMSYRPLRSPLIEENGFVDRFGRKGERLTITHRAKPWHGHEIVAPGGAITDDDLHDSIFERVASDGASAPYEVRFLDETGPEGAVFRHPLAADRPPPRFPADIIAARLEATVHEAVDGSAWLRREWVRGPANGPEQRLGAWWTALSTEDAAGETAAQRAARAAFERATQPGSVLHARLGRYLSQVVERRGR